MIAKNKYSKKKIFCETMDIHCSLDKSTISKMRNGLLCSYSN